MLKHIKKEAMNQVMKLMSNPKVTSLIANPKVMNAISRGFEFQGQLRSHVMGGLQALANGLNLATQDDLSSLKQKLTQVESQMDNLDAKLQETKKKPTARKKKAPAEPDASKSN